jgi:hypothetical protein
MPPAREVLAANDRPGIALVGCGGRGFLPAKLGSKFGNLAAVCGVDAKHLAKAADLAPGLTAWKDFRLQFPQFPI